MLHLQPIHQYWQLLLLLIKMNKFKITDHIKLKLRRKDEMKNGITLSGEMLIETRRDGKTIEREVIKNLIVNVGKERVAKLLGNVDSADFFDYIAIGTGVGEEAAGDTNLGTEVTREQATIAYEADYKCKFEKTFTFGSGEEYAITEACLSDSAVISGEIILNRKKFTAKNVDSDTDLYIKITITVS